jgi:hypothetical protein
MWHFPPVFSCHIQQPNACHNQQIYVISSNLWIQSQLGCSCTRMRVDIASHICCTQKPTLCIMCPLAHYPATAAAELAAVIIVYIEADD